jgi:hypothetical protein
MTPSPSNSTITPLTSGSTWTGRWELVAPYNTVTTALKTDQAGTLYMEFSPDGVNADSVLSFDVAASTNELHRLTAARLYYRARFTNSGSNQTYLRLQTLYGDHPLLTSTMNSTISADSDTLATRSVLYGETDSGSFEAVPVDTNGHLEVGIHSPRLPFGSIHTERLEPILQGDAIYGVNTSNHAVTLNASGTATASDSAFVCTTGVTIYGAGSLQSRERLIYRPGQGIILRFTGLFTTGVASSYQVVGFGHAEDGVFFGFKGTQFGIIYNSRGKREVRTLTISTKSSTVENAVVTLNDVAYNVAVTNGANTIQTAWEVAQGTYSGWNAEAIGSTVVFVANSVGSLNGAYSISGATVVGTFARSSAGQAVTESFTAQSSWNGDKMDGTGNSGVTIDPTKFNVFQIGLQYLGAGAIVFQVEAAYAGNNPDWITVHTLLLPNTLTKTSFGNPTFPFTMSAYSAGSTTDLTVKCGSYAAFIEGERKVHGDRLSYTNTLTTVGATNYQCIFTIRNTRYFGGRTNQTVIKILSVLAALKHTSPCTIYLFRNATLAGVPNFATWSANSCALYDSAATTCTIASNNQLVWTGTLGDTGNLDFQFNGEEIRLQPGETMTLAAKSTTGTPAYVVGSLNTKEYQ